MHLFRLSIVSVLPLSAIGGTQAQVIEFTDKAQWEAAAGEFTTIDFTGLPDGTILTNEYDHIGVTFAYEPWPEIRNHGAFTNDGWGLSARFGASMTFDEPMYAIAYEAGQPRLISLYHEGQLIYETDGNSLGPLGPFGGIVSAHPFDEAYIFPFGGGNAALDDLHFGAIAPDGEQPKLDPPPSGDFGIEFTDKAEWVAATRGHFATLDFSEGPVQSMWIPGSFELGVNITYAMYAANAGDGWVFPGGSVGFWPPYYNGFLFPNDLWGGLTVNALLDPIMVTFEEPQHFFALEHPWVVKLTFHHNGTFVGTSSRFGTPSGVGQFAGIISDEPFTHVEIRRPKHAFVLFDDLHFGAPPSPGDLTGDGTVGVDDLLILLEQWGDCDDPDDCPVDLTNDGAVGVDDLLILLANWTA